ncbi:hypothetical protein BgiBS90_036304 [Biomphalaria glabrata]|nr:hypothetical protein BgiBS90_036304 [Biomphalaria glabrata]
MPRRPSSKKHPGKATVREHWGAGGRGQAITTNQIPAARRREADILGNIIAATYRVRVRNLVCRDGLATSTGFRQPGGGRRTSSAT